MLHHLKKIVLVFFAMLLTSPLLAQTLTLPQLLTYANMKNWTFIDHSLTSRGWTFFNSGQGYEVADDAAVVVSDSVSATQVDTVIWSYGKDYYDDKAAAWFRAIITEGDVSSVDYQCPKNAYLNIKKALSSNGFKFSVNQVNDGAVVSVYKNKKFILQLISIRNDESLNTLYHVCVSPKPELPSGVQTLTTEDGGHIDYTLKNGVMNGPFKVYYADGTIGRAGSCLNGEENGIIREFDERGRVRLKYTAKNGQKTGLVTIYTYIDDFADSASIEATADVASSVRMEECGQMLNGERQGTWKVMITQNGKSIKTFQVSNYVNGVLSGPYMQCHQGRSFGIPNLMNLSDPDTLEYGSYQNGVKSGLCKMYVTERVNLVLKNGTCKLDSITYLCQDGYYRNDLRTGLWKTYSPTGSWIVLGRYDKGKMSGEWDYYYPDYAERTGEDKSHFAHCKFSNQMYKSETYVDGQLNGKVEETSNLTPGYFKLAGADDYLVEFHNGKRSLSLLLDTAYMYAEVYRDVTYYKNGQRNGLYESYRSNQKVKIVGNCVLIDSKNKSPLDVPDDRLVEKGRYVADQMDGTWYEYDSTGKVQTEERYIKNVLSNRKKFIDGVKVAEFSILNVHPTNFQVRFTGFAKGVMSLSQEYRINRELTIESADSLDELILNFVAYPTEVMRYGKSILCDSLGRPVVVSSIIGNTPGDTSYFYDYTHGACDKIVRAGEDVSEMFYTADHEPYSGDFLFPAESSQDDLQVASVKDGLRNGKTVIIDRATGKVKEKMKFKNGMRK